MLKRSLLLTSGNRSTCHIAWVRTFWIVLTSNRCNTSNNVIDMLNLILCYQKHFHYFPMNYKELSVLHTHTHTQHTHIHTTYFYSWLSTLLFCGFKIILKIITKKGLLPPHCELTQTFFMAPGMLTGSLGLGYIHQMFESPFPCDPELLRL